MKYGLVAGSWAAEQKPVVFSKQMVSIVNQPLRLLKRKESEKTSVIVILLPLAILILNHTPFCSEAVVCFA